MLESSQLGSSNTMVLLGLWVIEDFVISNDLVDLNFYNEGG